MNLKKSIFMLVTTATVASGVFFSENVHAASPSMVEGFISAAGGAGGAKSAAYINQMRNHFNTHPELTDDAVSRATGLIFPLVSQISSAYASGILTKDDLASADTLIAALRAKVPGAVPLLNQIMSDVKWGAAQVASLVSPDAGAGSSSNLLKNTGIKQNTSMIALFSLVGLALTAAFVNRHKGCGKTC
ncbi:MAG: hypothetical protein LBI41_01600 [Lactobacillales bacterium]|jgi:hypothetical protein|nr:hypothetical protein [Lactobacillales bacterium]